MHFSETLLLERVSVYMCMHVCLVIWGFCWQLPPNKMQWAVLDLVLQVEGGGYDSGLEAGCWQR